MEATEERKIGAHNRKRVEKKEGIKIRRRNSKSNKQTNKRLKERRDDTQGCLTKLSGNSSAFVMASSIASSATRRATVSVSAILCPGTDKNTTGISETCTCTM